MFTDIEVIIHYFATFINKFQYWKIEFVSILIFIFQDNHNNNKSNNSCYEMNAV